MQGALERLADPGCPDCEGSGLTDVSACPCTFRKEQERRVAEWIASWPEWVRRASWHLLGGASDDR